MTRSRPPKLIEDFIDLKWAELDAFALMLRRSSRSAAPVDTIKWVHASPSWPICTILQVVLKVTIDSSPVPIAFRSERGVQDTV